MSEAPSRTGMMIPDIVEHGTPHALGADSGQVRPDTAPFSPATESGEPNFIAVMSSSTEGQSLPEYGVRANDWASRTENEVRLVLDGRLEGGIPDQEVLFRAAARVREDPDTPRKAIVFMQLAKRAKDARANNDALATIRTLEATILKSELLVRLSQAYSGCGDHLSAAAVASHIVPSTRNLKKKKLHALYKSAKSLARQGMFDEATQAVEAIDIESSEAYHDRLVNAKDNPQELGSETSRANGVYDFLMGLQPQGNPMPEEYFDRLQPGVAFTPESAAEQIESKLTADHEQDEDNRDWGELAGRLPEIDDIMFETLQTGIDHYVDAIRTERRRFIHPSGELIEFEDDIRKGNFGFTSLEFQNNKDITQSPTAIDFVHGEDHFKGFLSKSFNLDAATQAGLGDRKAALVKYLILAELHTVVALRDDGSVRAGEAAQNPGEGIKGVFRSQAFEELPLGKSPTPQAVANFAKRTGGDLAEVNRTLERRYGDSRRQITYREPVNAQAFKEGPPRKHVRRSSN